MPAVSAIFTTYNTPRFLELCLLGFGRQTYRDLELIVADDGSTEETAEVIRAFADSTDLPVKHVWQEDEGYRKCHILNAAVRASDGEYLVFTDGDCVPHSKFVADHVANRAPRTALTGRRVKWGQAFTETVTPEYIRSGKYERLDVHLALSFLRGDSRRATRAVRISQPTLASWISRVPKRLHGSNFSLDKEALIEVNGFDEDFVGPGYGPDREVALRLEHAGYEIRSLLNLALVYHLFHREVPRPPINEDRFLELKENPRRRCENGLVKS